MVMNISVWVRILIGAFRMPGIVKRRKTLTTTKTNLDEHLKPFTISFRLSFVLFRTSHEVCAASFARGQNTTSSWGQTLIETPIYLHVITRVNSLRGRFKQ